MTSRAVQALLVKRKRKQSIHAQAATWRQIRTSGDSATATFSMFGFGQSERLSQTVAAGSKIKFAPGKVSIRVTFNKQMIQHKDSWPRNWQETQIQLTSSGSENNKELNTAGPGLFRNLNLKGTHKMARKMNNSLKRFLNEEEIQDFSKFDTFLVGN